MWLLDLIFGTSAADSNANHSDDFLGNEPHHASVNPANGLPMLNESIDVAGNAYGTDNSSAGTSFGTDSISDDMFGDSSAFDSLGSSDFDGFD